MEKTMKGAVLPGNRTVMLRDFPIPEPGPGQVLVKMKASTVCGSDIHGIYRKRSDQKPEEYRGVICGHEPCGQIAELGQNTRRFKMGDRVLLYHIAGCGICHNCRMGYMINCTGPERAAYGWDRDGGMAEYLLAEENTCIHLPESLSYIDGAYVACGFGTVWEALTRVKVSGEDNVMVVGLGPVGMAAMLLSRSLGAKKIIGVEATDERLQLAKRLNLGDVLLKAGSDVVHSIKEATDGSGCEVSIDCSGSPEGRLTAIQGTSQWGRVAFVGEGNTVTFRPSQDIMHKQITIYGSWVTSLGHMEDLVEHLVRCEMHPEITVTHRFPLEQVEEAFRLMDEGKCGKIAIVFDD
jgi:threonine dehydrogenase-like Zn-dependent dehydrogenase